MNVENLSIKDCLERCRAYSKASNSSNEASRKFYDLAKAELDNDNIEAAEVYKNIADDYFKLCEKYLNESRKYYNLLNLYYDCKRYIERDSVGS